MSKPKLHHLPLFLLFLALSPTNHSLSWPFSSPPPAQPNSLKATPPTFSIDRADNPKGVELLMDAERKLAGPTTCWQNAYRSLYSSCSEIAGDKEKQKRLAWHLSDCFQKDSGRPPFPACDPEAPMLKCLKSIDDLAHKVYLEFFVQTNFICHQLQSSAFKHNTERLINDLVGSARFTEEKLETMEERSEHLVRDSIKIQDSLASLDDQAQQLAKGSRDAEARIHDVLKHSEAIHEHSKGIAASQMELREGQVEMKERLDSGMARLQESYESLGDEMEKLKNEALEIEREVKEVGDSMTLKLNDLQSTADDIGNVAGISLEKQKKLLDGQTVALEGLDSLTKFQSEALQESRETFQRLAESAHKQQEELLQRQEQIQQAHDRLMINSQSILAAQEEFESKQANIFAALDKLFVLHNAILVESRFVKSFFFYSSVIFLLYMLTSAKQTFGIRAHLYFGLCVAFAVELVIARSEAEQTWIASRVFIARLSFLIAGLIHITYSIFTYRDYEILNHRLLQNLAEKIRSMEESSGKRNLPIGEMSDDMSLGQFSWIDEEFPEEVNSNIDPNYALPEEVGDSFCSMVTRKYDLRPRSSLR